MSTLAPSPPPSSALLSDLSDRFYLNAKRTRHMFLSNYAQSTNVIPTAESLRLSSKITDEYNEVKHLANTPTTTSQQPRVKAASIASTQKKTKNAVTVEDDMEDEKTTIHEPSTSQLVNEIDTSTPSSSRPSTSTALTLHSSANDTTRGTSSALILRERARQQIKPQWHAPWKLMRVLAGHTGWVRCLAVDPANEWFATGSNDRTIKIWDLASGTLKLSLTGHISGVRGLAVSARHPYLFSVGEDKTVKCWDLEQNKSIRQYHGHLSGVYTCSLHPSLDILITGGRDATARVWDIRTRNQVAVLAGHTATVGSICTQEAAPQVVTGSHDSTIKLWDLTAAKAYSTLTHHKKSVRALRIHPLEYTFASGAADNMKVWKCPEGTFLRNISGHNTIINAMSINRDNVLASAGDNGSIHFYDWKTGYNFQQLTTPAQPGSLDSECGIFAMEYDMSGSRLITVEADKSVKIYKEDENATPESHPIDFKPKKRKRF